MTTLFGFALQPSDVLALVALPFAAYVVWLGESLKRAERTMNRTPSHSNRPHPAE